MWAPFFRIDVCGAKTLPTMGTGMINIHPEENLTALINGQSKLNSSRRRIMMDCSEVISQYGTIETYKFKEKRNLRIDFHILSDKLVPLIQHLRSKKIMNEQNLTDYRINPAPKENMFVTLDLKLAS